MLIEQFQKEHPGIHCEATFGSSGSLFAQLTQRAPFDLFLSADVAYTRTLEDQGLILPESRFSYAMGHLVLWAPQNSPLNLEMGLKCLESSEIRKIAIANPEVAPYGRAAVAALKSSNLYEPVQSRLVLGENLAQAAQFVQSGGADVGLLSLSLALAPEMKKTGRYYELPASTYPSIEQAGVILAWAQSIDATRQFRDFLRARTGQEILKQHGLTIPGE